MKKKISRHFIKQVMAGIFALALIAVSAYFMPTEGKEVLAADAYTADSYTADEVSSTYWGKAAPTPKDTAYAGWVFAGWMDSEGNVVSEIEAGATYYAKFLHPDVLSVKVQVPKNTKADTETVNMRLISSVDGLSYSGAGFEVYYNGATECTLNAPANTVFQRIVASSTSGVAYNFGPKIVDTKSEYFMTYTLLDIINDNFNKVFEIRPYWKTLDGVTVYGVTRFVKVEDYYNHVTNVPVYLGKDAETVDYTAAAITSTNTSMTGVTVATDGYEYDETTGWANFRVKMTFAEGYVLPSASTITVTVNGETHSTIFRNNSTSYLTNGTADTSWYTEYAQDENETEFVIATSADLYGFASLSASNAFSGDKIYLAADIVANNGSVTSTTTDDVTTYSWTPAATDGTEYDWPRVATSNTYAFAGVFDGCNHTISGLKNDASNARDGFFAYVGSCEIKNFSITDSLFKSGHSTNGYVGSVVGQVNTAGAQVEISNVHSSANIVTTAGANQTGGIIARFQGSGASLEVKNCWFSGTITQGGAETYGGGIVGAVVTGTATIDNCLNTGAITITSTTPHAAGIFGGLANKDLSATMTNCINTGNISSSATTYVGQIYGGRNRATTLTTSNLYGAGNLSNLVSSGTSSYITYAEGSQEPTKVTASNITGATAYHFTNLDFANSWAIQEGVIPVPKAFADNEIDFTGATKADIGWYSNGTANENGGYDYSISNAAELYGLMVLVNGGTDTFKDDVINLTGSIDLNPGWDGALTFKENGSPDAPEDAKNLWVPIGTSASPFEGTFNGANNKVSGLFIHKEVEDGNSVGFFGYTTDCVIKDLGLVNGYIYEKNLEATAYTGTVIGWGEGYLQNVYSDVNIYAVGSYQIGGLIGKADRITSANSSYDTTISNCCYEGTIVLRTTSHPNVETGGIVGYSVRGNLTLDYVLFNGNINFKNSREEEYEEGSVAYLRIGGLIARDNSGVVITINDSLVAGTIELNERTNVSYKLIASIVARKHASSTVTCTNVYTTHSDLLIAAHQSTYEEVVLANVTKETTWSDIRDLNSTYWTMSTTIPVLSGLNSYAGWEYPQQ